MGNPYLNTGGVRPALTIWYFVGQSSTDIATFSSWECNSSGNSSRASFTSRSNSNRSNLLAPLQYLVYAINYMPSISIFIPLSVDKRYKKPSDIYPQTVKYILTRMRVLLEFKRVISKRTTTNWGS
jgi:hypothetical protein